MSIDLPIIILISTFLGVFGFSFVIYLNILSKKDKYIEDLEVKLRQYEEGFTKGEVKKKSTSYEGMKTSLVSEQIKKIEQLENEVIRQKNKVEDAKEIAKEAVQVKYEFLSNVKEDFKSPLSSIIALSSVLVKEVQVPKLNNYSKEIYTAANKVLKLVEEMIELSKADAGNYQVEENAVELKPLFEKLLDLYELSIKKKKLELHFDIDKSLPESLMLDAPKVKSIVENLLSNAIKFTTKGSVNIYVKPNGFNTTHNTLNLQIIVEDSGVGIKKEDQTKIFEMFESSGLGLALNKKTAKLMGGDLTFYSEYGKGATFIFSLNDIEIVLSSAEDENHDMDIDFSKIAKEGATVMVIDEDENSCALIEESFLQSHIEVHSFSNPRDALEKLKQSDYGIIFIDIETLTTDENALSKVIAKLSKAPVVTLTHERVKNIEFVENGAKIIGHLKKPISKRELFKISIKALNFPELLK